MIPFNKHPFTGHEEKYIQEAIKSSKISGDGPFTKKCHQWFEHELQCHKSLLTTSCTHSLEIAALLLNIKDGDEVIMPSYTFVSTANAFVLRGAKIVFVDIRKDTLNIDEKLIEQAVTKNTKAIVPVHYAGVACAMDEIMEIANKHNLFVIEDAAQAMGATYKNRKLGTIGHLGTYSFHETKNYTSAGEGGLLIINDKRFLERAEIIREKGTNRSQFFRGMIDKYSWVDIGSSYLMNDISAAYLWGQLQSSDEIKSSRIQAWEYYNTSLQVLNKKGLIDLPTIPESCSNNAHMFYLKLQDIKQRAQLIEHLKKNQISAAFHYVPLHNSVAGLQFGRVSQSCQNTVSESERLVRLPLFYGISKNQLDRVIQAVVSFFN